MDEYIADYSYAGSISCIAESSSVAASAGDTQILVTAYEKIFVWNISTLSIDLVVAYDGGSSVSAVAAAENAAEGLQILVGHENGIVKCIDASGNEVFGFREHIKKIVGITVGADIAVAYTTSAFTLVDLRTERAVCTVSVPACITAVKIVNNAVVAAGTAQGIVSLYKIQDLLLGLSDASDMIALPGNQILDFVVEPATEDDVVYAVFPEFIVNLATRKEIRLKHRISCICTRGNEIFSRDKKGRCRWISVKNNVLDEKVASGADESAGSMCLNRPVAAVVLFGEMAVSVFADNGLAVHRLNGFTTSVEGGRENLVGVVYNRGCVLGIAENEGRLFASNVSGAALGNRVLSSVLFEDDGMLCVSVLDGRYYIGKTNGTVSVRDAAGEQIDLLKVSDSPVVSLDATETVIAIGTDTRVVLLNRCGPAKATSGGCLSGLERDELEYDDDVVCVRVSVDGSLILASLTDNTVKVHKIDGTKVLSLYGHSVPVVDVHICLRANLIYTLGGDKLVKIWGISHGDCRKTINPIDPSGFMLLGNALIVSTAGGIVYYLASGNFEQVKRVEYKTGKKRSVPGQNRIAATNNHEIAVVRERAVSMFAEGEYGTSPLEQKVLAERKQEIEEISKEKIIYKISAIEELEIALDQNNHEMVWLALKKLSKEDIEKSVDIMNTVTQDNLIEALLAWEYGKIDSPLAVSWTLSHLARKQPRNERIVEEIAKVRLELRKQARLVMANRAAILWSIHDDTNALETATTE